MSYSKNLGRAGMACTMKSISLRVGATDLQQRSRAVGADEHDEIVETEHSDGVSVDVQHIFVGDPMLPGTRQNHRVHYSPKLS